MFTLINDLDISSTTVTETISRLHSRKPDKQQNNLKKGKTSHNEIVHTVFLFAVQSQFYHMNSTLLSHVSSLTTVYLPCSSPSTAFIYFIHTMYFLPAAFCSAHAYGFFFIFTCTVINGLNNTNRW